MKKIVIIILLRVTTLIKRLLASRDELERRTSTDPMTKLFNRRYLSEVSQPLLELTQRNSSELAKVQQTYTRKSDIICRFGGEEFGILLPETTMNGAL